MTRLAYTLETTARIVAASAADRVARDILAAHGYPTGGSSDGRVSGGGLSDPTATAACVDAGDRRDAAKAIRYLEAVEDAQRACSALCAAISDIAPRALRDDVRAGQGKCTACDTDCPGTSTHRLRSSLCPKCWQAWTRWQDHRGSGLTRADWSDPDSALRPVTLQDAADLTAYRMARRAKLDAQGKLDGLTVDVTPVRDRRDPIVSQAIGTMAHIHGWLGS